jgi:hypothetical protein
LAGLARRYSEISSVETGEEFGVFLFEEFDRKTDFVFETTGDVGATGMTEVCLFGKLSVAVDTDFHEGHRPQWLRLAAPTTVFV